MDNPFPKSGFFATPSSIEDISNYCNSLSGSEKMIAFVIASMSMNLAHEMFNKATKKVTND